MTLFVGLDLGGTNIRCVVADAKTERPSIVGRDERATPDEGGDAVILALVSSARAALDRAGSSLKDVVAIGCASPGPLDPRTGVVHQTQNIARFTELPLGPRLSRALDGASVFLERDTVAAVIAELSIGAARGVADVVYVTVSTGFGGAIVAGGRIVRGAAGTAGEIGHWPVSIDPDAPRCRSGDRGCVEAYAGGRHIAEAFGVTDAEAVYEASTAGDARARAIIDRAEAAVAALAVGLVNGLSPARIVVGGSIAEHQPAHVLEPMRRAIAERAFRAPAAAVTVVPAALGADVGLYGAVLLARDRTAGRAEWDDTR